MSEEDSRGFELLERWKYKLLSSTLVCQRGS